MIKKRLSDDELYKDLLNTIKEKIEEQINDEYTALKLQWLDNLEYRLEARRNEIVKEVLDSIDIIFSKDEMSVAPTIQINIIKK